MEKEKVHKAEYVVLGQVFEALLYDAESVSRTAAIKKLKLLLNDKQDDPQKNAIVKALKLLC